MKALMIVARDSMIDALEELLQNIGIDAYTVVKKVEGRGDTGKVSVSFIYPDCNTIIFAVLPPDQVARAVTALKEFRETRVKVTHGQPLPFKLFSFPCEELI
jgi:nitrogen regulatory protein PII